MPALEDYDHQSGVHCGAASLRNVTAFLGLDYTEAACFGIGGGLGFALHEEPAASWVSPRTSPAWLVPAFLEREGIPHVHRTGDDFETAWANATTRIDDDEPVVCHLDPAHLEYLPEPERHLSPHVVVLTGYDNATGEVELSDPAAAGRKTVGRPTFRDAWSPRGGAGLANEYVAITRGTAAEGDTDAAAAGLRQAATAMLAPLQVERDSRGPGEEGVAAIRSFADYLAEWPALPEPSRPVAAARRNIEGHGEGSAHRGLFADALRELGQRTDLPPDLADRLDEVADEWAAVADHLRDIEAAEAPDQAAFETTGSLVADIADREEAVAEDLAEAVGAHVELD